MGEAVADIMPSPLAAPWKVLAHGERHLVIDVDGGLRWLNETKVYHPFPISITNAVVIKNHLVATWVDHELRLARMAAIPLENGFEEGPRRGDLRAQGNASPLQVAGAAWSHTLDSEPVAMACDEETVYFALWTRGIYALDVHANERWRAEIPAFLALQKRPRSDELLSLTFDEYLNVWSRGGGLVRMSKETGECIDESDLEIQDHIVQVFKGNGHLLCSANGDIWWHLNETKLMAKIGEPVRDAVWDQGWKIISWSRDLTFDPVSEYKRKDLPVQLLKQSHWNVIDNQNKIDSFLGIEAEEE